MKDLSSNKRIAKNTFYLYLRTLLVMIISIYTSRVVLDILGVEDFGIYSVVGGFVSMFSILSGTLTAASQRFISFELGKEDCNVQNVFSTTITIHMILALIMVVLLESVGLWFLNCRMNISPERLLAANWVFQCSVITFCINIISIPYSAAIIAYERMSAFAYIGIFEVVLKLSAIFLLYFISFDSLIIYAVLMMGVAIILRCAYGRYCNLNFKECRYKYCLDRRVYGEILSFCGWNFIGSTATVLNTQGINLLSNIFFGVAINATRGIAIQVDSAINTFVQNFMMALNPQITKNYAAQNFQYVNQIILEGTKYAFFLFWIICLPVFLNVDYILEIWLKKVPPYSNIFVRLCFIYTLIQNLSQCLYTAMLATGKIKKYQLIIGSLSLLAFPITYLLFSLGFSPEWGYIAMIIFSIICLFARLVLLKEMVPLFNPFSFIRRVIVPVLMTIIIPSLLAFAIHDNSDICLGRFLYETIICFIVNALSIWFIGITKSEHERILSFLLKKLNRKI